MLIPGKQQFSALRAETLGSAADFVRIWLPLAKLRASACSEDDVLTDPVNFLASTDDKRRSCSVACWMGEELIGVLFATSHYELGLPTGYALAGDYTGRGSLLCLPEHQNRVIECAVRHMLRRSVHSLHLRVSPADQTRPELAGLAVEQLDDHIPGDRMALAETYEAFLATLGKHTRRNVRYYTRRASAAGIVFDPDVSVADYAEAVERLNRDTGFAIEALRLARDERILELHEGKRFALRDANGRIVAALCGFSKHNRFHMLTQTNDARLAELSLSLVLRGFTAEHLIATNHTVLQFMGGSSLSFGRFCAKLDYRSLFIDRRFSLATCFKLLLCQGVKLLSLLGKPVPGSVEILCGGFLPEDRLIARTALQPAAVLKREAQARAAQNLDGIDNSLKSTGSDKVESIVA